jgi:two-component system cell cycle sensor histidine kinase/response regulator CckA
MEMHATLDSRGPHGSIPPAPDSKLKAAGLLSAGMLHDLNNLLTVINGYNEMLLNSYQLPEKARQCLSLVRGAGERAASLARAMMDLGSRAPQHQPVDVNASVSELVELAKHLLPENIELASDLSVGLRLALAERCGILQVLLNLVVNARDAMPDGGRVEIQTCNFHTDTPSLASHPFLPHGNYILLSVTDNGAGMDESTRQRMFEPFYTTKPAGVGTGLGLPMVQHIVKQNGGFLSIQSAMGVGTTVRIYLPAADDSLSAPNLQTRPLDTGAMSGRETVLLVEDDAVLRNLMRDILQDLGYAVLDASTAAEAAELSGNLDDGVDLLISSVALPDSSGRELAEALLETRPGLPVLYISGHPALVSHDDPSDPDARFLAKPFGVGEFGERVRSLLDRRKRKRVLVVDDDTQVVMFASEVLREAGYEVLVGEDGNVALSIVEKEPLDLVITDLVMREREGLETMMRLRKSHPELPVVAISGAFGGHFLRSASLLGARATLAKPFSGEDLLNVVRRLLES